MPTTLTPYLSFRGNTREAFAFYAQALGAEIQAMMRFADMPAPPAGDDGCAGGPAPGADGAEGAGDGMQGVMLALQYDSVAQAEQAFAALLPGGQVTMPLAPAFWARTFGMLTDRFGVSWAIGGEALPMP